MSQRETLKRALHAMEPVAATTLALAILTETEGDSA